ncbi:IS200/IS605 family element transposase accessory protein TnpB [Scytonema sp. UIC 10036]|uniref:IS200/IS605 family accessory protein TnpB-related protein n=1 Tax=Scytonema sp. UIC 10036 TaxID=2304196 RepID=UPI0012DA987A|nr:IS200/IS605 family accessory protein TnpB-related protein [Scytonema sp. UIC 10036]MUG94870.1 IS200/IS605 family element transposase accessory protein TnpB [Scytonema sp. UIC 10036]MUG99450.1 IS200/IS605 family element transposase accessory protein TnpB [Scytonema sp. UIC 10036]
MPQVYQTYVTQIENNLTGETRTLEMLEEFSPVAAEMSQIALEGLQSDMKKEKLNSQIQNTFGVNKRHANSVINFVTGELESAIECKKRHLDTLDTKIKSVKSEIERLNKRLKNHREYAQAVEKYNLAIKYPQKTKTGTLKKVPVLKKIPEFDNACPINGKPHGKTYLQLAKQQLHQKKRQLKMYLDRRAAFVLRGVKPKLGNLGTVTFVGSTNETSGNQICQLTPDVIPSLKIRVPYFLEATYGEYLTLPLYKINKQGYDNIVTAWALNNALTYVFSRNKKGKWVVAITCLVNFSITSNDRAFGCIGLDINPGAIGWCATNRHGNPIAWGKVNLDLHSCSTEQTEARLAGAITELTNRALATKKPIVIEKLDFSEKKRQGKRGRKYNRMLSGFAYAKFKELLKARCLKLGIKIIEVSPKYSSQIGVVKYMRRYGMGSDSAAGLVLARRGMNIYYERMPARYALQSSIQPEPRQHVFAHWQGFNKHYLEVGSRNAWFGTPTLTGSAGDGLANTGNLGLTKLRHKHESSSLHPSVKA